MASFKVLFNHLRKKTFAILLTIAVESTKRHKWYACQHF